MARNAASAGRQPLQHAGRRPQGREAGSASSTNGSSVSAATPGAPFAHPGRRPSRRRLWRGRGPAASCSPTPSPGEGPPKQAAERERGAVGKHQKRRGWLTAHGRCWPRRYQALPPHHHATAARLLQGGILMQGSSASNAVWNLVLVAHPARPAVTDRGEGVALLQRVLEAPRVARLQVGRRPLRARDASRKSLVLKHLLFDAVRRESAAERACRERRPGPRGSHAACEAGGEGRRSRRCCCWCPGPVPSSPAVRWHAQWRRQLPATAPPGSAPPT